MSEGFTCCGCGNLFFQAPKCVTCGAQKLYDSTVKLQGKEIKAQAARIERLDARIVELKAEAKLWRGENFKKQTACEQMGKRIAELEAALRNIEADCESDYPPSYGAIKYAARAALTGGKDE